MELKEYRSFIDEEMITILGQMDSASKIFDHVYLVSKQILIIKICFGICCKIQCTMLFFPLVMVNVKVTVSGHCFIFVGL